MSSLDTPSTSALEKRGVIEIDTFCAGCFYNLHGQVVTIDERLGFPVCRCPECGKYHPAGTGVTASSVWVRRIATSLLFSWIITVLACTIAIAGAMAGLDAASINAYEHGYLAAADGRPVNPSLEGGYLIQGTAIKVTRCIFIRQLYPWDAPSDQLGPGLLGSISMTAVTLFLGVMAGILCVTLLWHWPRRRYFCAALISLIPAALISIPFMTNAEYIHLHTQCLERIGTQAGFQCLGILFGVTFGRTISRGIIRSIIPPKPRQALAFLWLVDGKIPPAAGINPGSK